MLVSATSRHLWSSPGKIALASGFAALVAGAGPTVGRGTPVAGGYSSAAQTAPAQAARTTLGLGSYAGPAHLVFTSDRDGDRDVYAASEDGRRVVAFTRNRVDDGNDGLAVPLLSAEHGWVAIVRSGRYEVVLIDPSGRHERRFGMGTPGAISPDGRWFAYTSEKANGEAWIMIVRTRADRARRIGYGDALSFSPNNALLLVDSTWVPNGASVVRPGGGRLRQVAPLRTYPFWSPRGSLLAYVTQRLDAEGNDDDTLWVVNAYGKPKPRAVARGGDLDYEQPVWLSEKRLAFLRDPETGDRETHVVDADGGNDRLVALTSGVGWSPDGTRMAYERGRADGDYELVVARLDDGRSRTLAFADFPTFAWSPTGGRLAVEAANRLYVANAAAGEPRLLRRGLRGVDAMLWAPDERALALQTRSGLAIVSVGTGRLAQLLRGGNNQLLGWARGAIYRGGSRAAPPPVPEKAAPLELQTRGRIREIASDGRRVAAIVGRSAIDCIHVVGWIAGTSRIVRFAPVARCTYEPETLFSLRVSGTAVRWSYFACGNYCHLAQYSASFTRPGVSTAGEDIEPDYTTPQSPPAPPRETHRGIRFEVAGGAIHLKRLSDGRTVTVRPSTSLVDAELEDAGLLYAYNARGKFQGRVVFVPFERLLARFG